MMDENGLRDLTEQYLSEIWNTDKYIEKLLPKEIEYLSKRDRIKVSPTKILVQLVGFSWEPLFISLCAYKPEKLILILNKFYNGQEGKARGEDYKEYIEKLKEKNLIDDMPEILPEPVETIDNTPEDVFRFLKKNALPYINEGKEVVIDITGSKKSMISGAYLFASYTNCPVSYLDYDEYSERYGKPYGFTCKINELKNPMELFKLREWSRVEELYKRYAFQSALETINDIKGATRLYIESNENEAIELLEECLEFYKLWDEGDYKNASEKYNQLKEKIPGIVCPTAVEVLDNWFDKDDLKKTIEGLEGLKNIEESIYLKDKEIFIYAMDELEKIKRLIEYKEDYRSGLLRAVGLSDFLLKARMIRLWVNNQFVIEMENENYNREKVSKKHPDLLSKIDKRLLEFAGAPYMIKALRREPSKKKKDYVLKLHVTDKEIKAHRSEDSVKLNKFWSDIDFMDLNLPDDIFDLRNKAIHFCVSVPKEIAEVALEFTERNLEEFKNNWLSKNEIKGVYSAMDWDDLCSICEINFLPKLRRNEDG